MSFEALLLQLTNVEDGYIPAFVIAIPLAIWGYLAYLKQNNYGK
ncbi:MAG: hypothetical protein WAM14_26945 [Candidatus Nitrosopolaris sp.]